VLNEQLQGFTAADVATLTGLLGRLIANGSGDGADCGFQPCAAGANPPSPEDGKQ
jgi:hypothetical protein